MIYFHNIIFKVYLHFKNKYNTCYDKNKTENCELSGEFFNKSEMPYQIPRLPTLPHSLDNCPM